jgi:hypothetical protein
MERSATSENPIICQENLRLMEHCESFIVPDAIIPSCKVFEKFKKEATTAFT